MTTMEVGKKLVAMCQQNKFQEAHSLYSPNIVSIEPFAPPGKNPRCEGIEAVLKKGEWWYANHEIHSATTQGPWPHGDRFIVLFKFDITAKSGPMQGKRFTMEETALYTVKDGKIVHEEFFYQMG